MTAPSLLSGLGKKKGKEPQPAQKKSTAEGPRPAEPTVDTRKRKQTDAPEGSRPADRTRARVDVSEGSGSSSSMGAYWSQNLTLLRAEPSSLIANLRAAKASMFSAPSAADYEFLSKMPPAKVYDYGLHTLAQVFTYISLSPF